MYHALHDQFKKGGWKNNSLKLADDSHFSQGVVVWEFFLQMDG
jgi:hypothetical protein